MKDPLHRKRRNDPDDPETLAKRARLAAMTPEERSTLTLLLVEVFKCENGQCEQITPFNKTPYHFINVDLLLL